MSASPNHWYVQTDFGALLGPMPEDALFEMARTGALLGRDRVREGSDGEWRPAESVPGLLDSSVIATSQASFSASPPSTSTFADMFNARPDRRATLPKSSDKRPLPEAEIEAKVELVATDVDVPAKHKEVFELFAEPEVSSPVVAVVPVPVVPDLVVPDVVEQKSEPPEQQEPATSIPASRPPVVRPVVPPQFKVAQPRRGRNWIIISMLAASPLLLFAAWWFWPSQRRDLSTNYVAIYQEWQQRLANSQDQVGWNEFVNRSKAQLENSIPWLEQNAVPGRVDLSLLLYVGRDLQEILNQPPSSKIPHQKRLSYFVEQLQEKYGMSQKTE